MTFEAGADLTRFDHNAISREWGSTTSHCLSLASPINERTPAVHITSHRRNGQTVWTIQPPRCPEPLTEAADPEPDQELPSPPACLVTWASGANIQGAVEVNPEPRPSISVKSDRTSRSEVACCISCSA
jgi:hypothetical protein